MPLFIHVVVHAVIHTVIHAVIHAVIPVVIRVAATNPPGWRRRSEVNDPAVINAKPECHQHTR